MESNMSKQHSTHEKYYPFFQTMNDYINHKKSQINNGINDYNMVNIVRKENAEVGMHSNVIYSLVDPHGLHYRGDLFLKLFIRDVLTIDDFGEILSVQAEEVTTQIEAKNRRIDFTIKSTKYYVGIEMKVDAYDLVDQISDYEEDLLEKSKLDRQQKVVIYYLTKDGKEAGKHSSKTVIVQKISFKEHILNWITHCQNEVKNITNLNLALENYKDVVKKITGQYKGNLMSLKEFLNEKNIEEFCEIFNEIDEMQEEVAEKFLAKLRDSLNGFGVKRDLECSNCIDILVGEYVIRLYFSGSELLLQIGDKEDKFKSTISQEKRKTFGSLSWENIKFDNSNWQKGYGELNLGKVRLQTEEKIINDTNEKLSSIFKALGV